MAGADRDQDVPDATARSGSSRGSVAGGHSIEHATQLPTAEPAATTDIQSYIASQLRAVFEDVAKQPIPDRFLDLMKQLG